MIITEEIEASLKQLFSRLSNCEKSTAIALSQQNQPVTIIELKKTVTLSQNDLIKTVRYALRAGYANAPQTLFNYRK